MTARQKEYMGDRELEDYLRNNLSYSPESGVLTWSKNLYKRKKGQEVGSEHSSGYLIFSVGFNKKHWSLRVHRVCWFLHTGKWPSDFLDHIDGVKTGVSWCKEKGKWVARIGVNGKHLFLGRFNCKTAAALAYDRASMKYHGEFGKRNFTK